MKETLIYWMLWTISMFLMLMVTYDILVVRSLSTSQSVFALFLLSSIPISYGYWSERQDVCS